MVLERKLVSLQDIEKVLKNSDVKYKEISLVPAFEEDLDEIKISLERVAFKKQDPLVIVEALRKLKGVREINLLMQ